MYVSDTELNDVYKSRGDSKF